MMGCEHVPIADGAMIVCGPRPRCECGRRGTLLCDWKVPARRSGTCDRPICARCATSPAPGKDLCGEHGHAFAVWKAGRQTPPPYGGISSNTTNQRDQA